MKLNQQQLQRSQSKCSSTSAQLSESVREMFNVIGEDLQVRKLQETITENRLHNVMSQEQLKELNDECNRLKFIFKQQIKQLDKIKLHYNTKEFCNSQSKRQHMQTYVPAQFRGQPVAHNLVDIKQPPDTDTKILDSLQQKTGIKLISQELITSLDDKELKLQRKHNDKEEQKKKQWIQEMMNEDFTREQITTYQQELLKNDVEKKHIQTIKKERQKVITVEMQLFCDDLIEEFVVQAQQLINIQNMDCKLQNIVNQNDNNIKQIKHQSDETFQKQIAKTVAINDEISRLNTQYNYLLGKQIALLQNKQKQSKQIFNGQNGELYVYELVNNIQNVVKNIEKKEKLVIQKQNQLQQIKQIELDKARSKIFEKSQ